ncbi:MAG: hypothetical protein ACI4PQ_02015 [Butyricicoccaceae bacterium]
MRALGVLQISFFQAEIAPVLLFFVLFFVIICGGIQIGNRVKFKPKEGQKPSVFSEMFREEEPVPDDSEARAAWNGTATVDPSEQPAGDAEWSSIVPAEQNGSADWNGTAATERTGEE